MKGVYEKGKGKATKLRSSSFKRDVELLLRMLKDTLDGKYTPSRFTLIMIALALLYFLFPLDFIFDFLYVVGFLDDATVVALVLKAIKDEVDRYASLAEPAEDSQS